MDFKQLETFLAVARSKSFSQAAKCLYITQPSASGHIAQLEEELGVALFDRNNRRTTLTAAGQVFYQSAQEMVNQREHALLNLKKYQENMAGILELGASNIPGRYLLPHYVLEFHQLYPDVVYQLHHLNSREVESNLLAGRLELGMIGAEPAYEQLNYHKIAEDELVVVCPAVRPFIEMETIRVEELLTYKLLLRQEGSASRQVLEQALKTRFGATRLNVLAYLDNNDLVLHYVELGLGLSVVSSLSVQDRLEKGRLCVLSCQDLILSRSFYFVYPARRTLSPPACRFRDMILKHGAY